MASGRRTVVDALTAGLVGAGVATAAAVAWGRAFAVGGWLVAVAVTLGLVPIALAAVSVLRRRPLHSSPADRVTLVRVVLAGGCAAVAVLVVLGQVPARMWWLVGLALPALLLDAVDGWLARRTGTATEDGARLDSEADAGLLLVLSVVVATELGGWVLLVGLARYAFVAASWVRPRLAAPLPPSRLRRPVAALQGAALVIALVPLVPVGPASVVVLVALLLLAVSFGRDVVALEHRGARLGLPGRRRRWQGAGSRS